MTADPDPLAGLTAAQIEQLRTPTPGQLTLTTHRLELPYGASPYLHANQRLHWREKADRTARIRRDVGVLAQAEHLAGQRYPHITVGLEWRPTMRRRRDGAENLYPLVKACIDGLVAVGVVDDDTPDHVTRTMPALLTPDRTTAGLWLLVSVLGGVS